GRLALLPGGTLHVKRVADAYAVKDAEKCHVVAWELAGFGLTPTISWFDDDGAWFADVADGFATIREGWSTAASQLLGVQKPLAAARREMISRAIARRPDKGLAIVHARLFDPTIKKAIDDATILVEGDQVKAAGPKLAPPAGYEVLDAKGKTALP